MTDLAIQIKERLLSIIELQNAIASMTAPADDVMRMAAERAASLTEATSATVSLVEGEELVAKAGAGVEVGKRIGVAHAGEVGKCVSERRPHRIDDHACVPIMYGEHAVGVIEIAGGRGGAFTDEDVDTLKLLSAICAIALHKAHSYPRPRADSTHDALTGLENRRAFDERVVTELGRSRRYGQSFSLAILDLAGFSAANDRLGQATGEKILRDIASILKAHTRVIDACFRLGGDEFAIVMPGTSLEGANILADRCRAQIATATVGDASITASFGVVESTTETMPEPLLARASDALMAAKHGNSHT